MKRTSAILLLMLLSPIAVAQDEDPWAGKASLGFLATTGNSENTSGSAAAEVSYTRDRWKHVLDALALGAQDTVDTTAEAYQLGWKSDYSLSESDYVFGTVRWQKDKFSGYDQQTSEGIGYGRRLINTDVHTLNAEIGAGAKQSTLRDGTKRDETILLGGLDYNWKFSETAGFGQKVRFESGSDNTYLESTTELKASLMENLALVASYTVQNNSDVPIGSEKTDTFTAISVEYGF